VGGNGDDVITSSDGDDSLNGADGIDTVSWLLRAHRGAGVFLLPSVEVAVPVTARAACSTLCRST